MYQHLIGMMSGHGGGDHTFVDSDAEAFSNAIGTLSTAQQAAIDDLVIDIKAISAGAVWTALKVIYPFVGGTSSAHAVNLKQPGTHNGTMNGGITHNSNGVTGNGTTGYINSNFNQSTHGAEDDEHISVYSRTDVNGTMMDCGVRNVLSGTFLMARVSNFLDTNSQSTTENPSANSGSLGYFSVNRTASTGYRKRKNATNTAVTQSSDVAPINDTFYFCAGNNNGTAATFSSRNYAWAAIGRGLTESDDDALRTAVETYQDALSRGVV